MQFGTLPITVSDLIERLVVQLQRKCGIAAECVFETLADDADHCEFPPADRFILVQPGRFVRDAGTWAGAGRYGEAYDGVFRVACLSRFAADQEFRNARELRDKTRAATALLMKVVNALDGFKMATADLSASYLREPIRSIDFDIRPKRVKQTAWSVIGSTWSVKFVLSLEDGTSDP